MVEKTCAKQLVEITKLKTSHEQMIGELSTMVTKIKERDDMFGADLTETDHRLNHHQGEINCTFDKVGDDVHDLSHMLIIPQ